MRQRLPCFLPNLVLSFVLRSRTDGDSHFTAKVLKRWSDLDFSTTDLHIEAKESQRLFQIHQSNKFFQFRL